MLLLLKCVVLSKCSALSTLTHFQKPTWVFSNFLQLSKASDLLQLTNFPEKPLGKKSWSILPFYNFEAWPLQGTVGKAQVCTLYHNTAITTVCIRLSPGLHGNRSNTSTVPGSFIPTNLVALPGTERRWGRWDVLIHAGDGTQRGIHVLQLLLQLLSGVVHRPQLLLQCLYMALFPGQLHLRGQLDQGVTGVTGVQSEGKVNVECTQLTFFLIFFLSHFLW